MPLSSSGLSIVRVELKEELVTEVSVNTSVELQSLTYLELLIESIEVKLLEIGLVPPQAGVTVQLMKLPLLVHWYEATSLEHTGPGPTSCVD